MSSDFVYDLTVIYRVNGGLGHVQRPKMVSRRQLQQPSLKTFRRKAIPLHWLCHLAKVSKLSALSSLNLSKLRPNSVLYDKKLKKHSVLNLHQYLNLLIRRVHL